MSSDEKSHFELRPGQLWSWRFSVGTGSWPVQVVTEDARHNMLAGRCMMIDKDDVFTVVTLDDPGPYEMIINTLISDTPTKAAKRYHVVLLKGFLVWFEHVWFEQAVLLTDVR